MIIQNCWLFIYSGYAISLWHSAAKWYDLAVTYRWRSLGGKWRFINSLHGQPIQTSYWSRYIWITATVAGPRLSSERCTQNIRNGDDTFSVSSNGTSVNGVLQLQIRHYCYSYGLYVCCLGYVINKTFKPWNRIASCPRWSNVCFDKRMQGAIMLSWGRETQTDRKIHRTPRSMTRRPAVVLTDESKPTTPTP